jgi:hypothetical protein
MKYFSAFSRPFFLAMGMSALGSVMWATPSLADPGRGANVQCYLWANQASPTLNVPYTPSPTYSFNAQNRSGGISVTKTATGTYSVTCTGVGGGSPWGPAGMCRSRPTGMASTPFAMSAAGARAEQTSPRVSIALARAAAEGEDRRRRTVNSICSSSGSPTKTWLARSWSRDRASTPAEDCPLPPSSTY